jgi:hypothetical protein
MADQTGEEIEEALRATSVNPVGPVSSYRLDTSGSRTGFSKGLVRPVHAREAMKSSDGFAVYEFGGLRQFATTKRAHAGGNAFVILALGGEIIMPATLITTGASRIYGSPDEVDAMASDPGLAFRTFLERCGVWFRSRNRRVRFLPVLDLPPATAAAIAGPRQLAIAIGVEIYEGLGGVGCARRGRGASLAAPVRCAPRRVRGPGPLPLGGGTGRPWRGSRGVTAGSRRSDSRPRRARPPRSGSQSRRIARSR